MTTIWMIEDLEPFADMPRPGELCRPTTYWATTEYRDIPAEMVYEVAARIEEVPVDGRVERRAHLGSGVTTMVPDGTHLSGNGTLRGCLVWDRYLWLDYRTVPVGELLVNERRYLTRRRAGPLPEKDGWYAVDYEGPMYLCSDLAEQPRDRDVVSYALSVSLTTGPSDSECKL
ncbi:MAG: hypothetical protein WBA00_04920 [Rhodococcus sp. (in: high G+C Gram-positive bacteria)]